MRDTQAMTDTNENDQTPAGDSESIEAGWHTDPFKRAEHRYHDGTAWTNKIATKGEESVDPFGTDEKVTTGLGDMLVSGAHAAKFTGTAIHWEGTGTLLDEPVLLVEQSAGILQSGSDYEIKSNDGKVLGTVKQHGQSQAKQLVRAFTKFDKYMTHKFELVDAEGNVVLRLTRPAKMRKSKVILEDGDGNEIGAIKQENTMGKVRFALEAGGKKVGRLKGKNWRDREFTLFDADDNEIGKVTKSWEGLKKAFMAGGDSYVLAMNKRLEDPLRLLVIGTGVCIDTALHIDD